MKNTARGRDLAYKDIHQREISVVVGIVQVRIVWNELMFCRCNPVAFSGSQNGNNGGIAMSLIMTRANHCDVMLLDCSDAVSRDTFIITMALIRV